MRSRGDLMEIKSVLTEIKEDIIEGFCSGEHLSCSEQKCNHKDCQYIKAIDGALSIFDQIQELIQTLEKENAWNRERVVDFEAMRRKTESAFYKKSYQRTIHQLNAKRETYGLIIARLKKILEE